MQQLVKRVSICLFVLLLFPGLKSNAEEFDLYTGEVKGAHRDLIVTKVEDKYFLHKEDLLPGDVIKGRYEISNTSTKDYELTLKSLTTSNSPTSWIKNNQEEVFDDWIKDIKLKLTLDGEIIYEGSAAGDDNLTEDKTKKFTSGIYLGKINQNTKRVLEAEFTIPENLDNDYQEAWARVDWIFSAKWATSGGGGGRNPEPDPKPTPEPNPKPSPAPTPEPNPKEEVPVPIPEPEEEPPFETPDTGDEIATMIIYVIIILGAISGIFLVIFSKNKE